MHVFDPRRIGWESINDCMNSMQANVDNVEYNVVTVSRVFQSQVNPPCSLVILPHVPNHICLSWYLQAYLIPYNFLPSSLSQRREILSPGKGRYLCLPFSTIITYKLYYHHSHKLYSSCYPLCGLILSCYLHNTCDFSLVYKYHQSYIPHELQFDLFPPLQGQFSSKVDTGFQHFYHSSFVRTQLLLYKYHALSSLSTHI